jgi:hypothetical protein
MRFSELLAGLRREDDPLTGLRRNGDTRTARGRLERGRTRTRCLTGKGSVKGCPSLGGISFGSSASPSSISHTVGSAITQGATLRSHGQPSLNEILTTLTGMSPWFDTLTRTARSSVVHHFTVGSMTTLTSGVLARLSRSSALRSDRTFQARPPPPISTVETTPIAAQSTLMGWSLRRKNPAVSPPGCPGRDRPRRRSRPSPTPPWPCRP